MNIKRIKKRENDRKYYQKHKDIVKKRKLERHKSRLLLDKEYKFRQDVEASHRCFKQQIIESFDNKCMKCGSNQNLQLHHLKYVKNKEGLKFVVVLCRECHINVHYPLPESSLSENNNERK